MNYKGIIIEESLRDISILEELEMTSQEVEIVTEEDGTPWLNHWTLDTVIIPQEKIENIAERLSQLIEIEYCNDWYCDFKNEEKHYIIFSNKVFCLDRTKKEDYEEMQRYALLLGLPKHQLPKYQKIKEELLKEFLIQAKKQTYANESAPKVISSRLGSHDYHFEKELEGNKMVYHDTYFGGLRFMGEEVVYCNQEIPSWGMNYYGITLNSEYSEEMMDKILRKALMKVGEEDILPLRGPKQFKVDDYTYTFTVNGSIDDFIGEERIYKKEELIYELHCHGGWIE